jgi:hypothetical protein
MLPILVTLVGYDRCNRGGALGAALLAAWRRGSAGGTGHWSRCAMRPPRSSTVKAIRSLSEPTMEDTSRKPVTIKVDDPQDVARWAQKLGISVEQLHALMKIVGNSVSAVKGEIATE